MSCWCYSLPGDSQESVERGSRWTLVSLRGKFERKVLIFVDVISEEEDVGASHFLGIVRRVMREALDGLLSASEVSLRERF